VGLGDVEVVESRRYDRIVFGTESCVPLYDLQTAGTIIFGESGAGDGMQPPYHGNRDRGYPDSSGSSGSSNSSTTNTSTSTTISRLDASRVVCNQSWLDAYCTPQV
jgi:hypothetical protein